MKLVILLNTVFERKNISVHTKEVQSIYKITYYRVSRILIGIEDDLNKKKDLGFIY